MNHHVKAAVRAQRLATVLSTTAQAYPRGHREGRALRAAARHLLGAGNALTASAVTGGPSRAADRTLLLARQSLDVDTRVDMAVIDHITAPVTGITPHLGTLASRQQDHARRQRWQRAQLLDLIPRLDDQDDEVATAAFVALIRLYRDRDRLVDDIHHGRTAQPTATFRTADGRRTGEHQPGTLAVFVGGRVIAELTVPLDITAGDIWQLIADTKPTTTEVSA
ncbi:MULTISPECIES: hypothetical protein [unclassified Streptomyces]|uniref:hypothetical protein n=1 Tax=unclassified Streptomyces TaxID=2593676 RepID=UPI00093E1D7B|nr:hypothetical protein [Streptomyces sp. TSRI0281]OKI35002.1 hypothetical protein A6A29_16385 [Streptomyces sp. TSRI0281]